VAIALFGLAGCAASSPEASVASNPWISGAEDHPSAPAAKTRSASTRARDLSGAVRGLRFTLAVVGDDDAANRSALALASSLMRAGFHLTDGPGDARIEIRALDRSADSPDEVVLALEIRHRDGVIDALVGRVNVATAESAAMDIEDLSQRVSSSQRVASFAAYIEQTRPSVALAGPRGPRIAPVDPAVLDEEAWRPAALRRCRNTRSEGACRWLRDYLDRFPKGAHAAEARVLLGLPLPPEEPSPSLASK
jgi:hypothetical protein